MMKAMTVISWFMYIAKDQQRHNSLWSEYKKERKDSLEKINSEMIRNVGQQPVVLSEHQGASIEVTLQPFDED